MSEGNDDVTETMPNHDGATFDVTLDKKRLNRQLLAVFRLMQDGAWRTLAEIEEALNEPQASVSARLRDLRKEKFGGHEVLRRRRGEGRRGLFEYRLNEIMHVDITVAVPMELKYVTLKLNTGGDDHEMG